MMTKLLNEVEELTKAELARCNEQHPLFASNHEGAAVIREEVEEAEDEMGWIKDLYHYLWGAVKDDEPETATKAACELKERAIRCACECIQVAAMCEKLKLSQR